MEYFGTNTSEHGHFRFNMDDENMVKMYNKFTDLPFHPEELTNNLPKGETVFYQGGGYTVLGISGSCKDERPGTKSIFWVKELIPRFNMIQKIMQNAAAMKIIRAIPFEIIWSDGKNI